MADYDGDLTDVNPDLLKLCANADDWREQRRRAMKAKIFGGGGDDGVGGDASTNANAYVASQGPAGPSPSSVNAIPASQQASESYILQQLLSHKRRRDEANQQPGGSDGGSSGMHRGGPVAQRVAPPSQQQQEALYGAQDGGEMSLKERLMRKYGKN